MNSYDFCYLLYSYVHICTQLSDPLAILDDFVAFSSDPLRKTGRSIGRFQYTWYIHAALDLGDLRNSSNQ